jgi:hypothetical protein
MIASNFASPNPEFPRFADVDRAVLERDEPALPTPADLLRNAWTDYLRRVLPPLDLTEEAAA